MTIDLAPDSDAPALVSRPRFVQLDPAADAGKPRRLGEVLLGYGLISEAQLALGLEEAGRRGVRLGQAFVELKLLSQDEICWALAHHLQIPYLALTAEMITPALVGRLPERLLRQFSAVPLVEVDDELTVAIADPTDLAAIEALQQAAGKRIKVAIATAEAIDAVLGRVFAAGAPAAPGSAFFRTITPLDVHLATAVKEGAEQVRFHPMADVVRITFHKGERVEEAIEPRANYDQVSTRLRKLAALPAATQQCYRAVFTHVIGEVAYRIRCSILPSLHGDAISLSFVGRAAPPRLVDLEVPRQDADRIKLLLSRGRGLVLVTGPDRAENVALLYAMLHATSAVGRATVVTIEEAVRFDLPGALQLDLAGLPDVSPERALRHALAYDPDVLLLDDVAAAPRLALHAMLRAAVARTLVLAAIETVDPLEGLTLLLGLAQAPTLLSSALLLLAARVSLPQLCPHCRRQVAGADPVAALILEAPAASGWRAAGCSACRERGRLGAIPIHALLAADDALRRALLDTAHPAALYDAVAAAGMSLREQGRLLLRAGKVSAEDLYARLAWPVGASRGDPSAGGVDERL